MLVRRCSQQRALLAARATGAYRKLAFRGSGLWLAIGTIMINRLMKVGSQLSDSFAMKADSVGDAQHTTHKNIVAWVELDTSGVAVINHSICSWCHSS